jgi:hypothetical protein
LTQQTKKVFISFDIETVVSKFSKNFDYKVTILQGALEIAKLLEEKKIKATFFISLSPKAKDKDIYKYLSEIRLLVRCLKGFEYVDMQPHLHALNIPVSFKCDSDSFDDYTLDQQVELLKWAKNFFLELGVDVSGFRPGGFNNGRFYYKALQLAGYSFSSTLNTKSHNIDLISREIDKFDAYSSINGIKEFYVTSVNIKSIKLGLIETINLSPDFFTYRSVEPYIKRLDSININFHSFSMYSNRLARENHTNQLANNIKYILLQKPVQRICNMLGMGNYIKKTIFRDELENWLCEFQKMQYKTFFYSEIK